MSEPLLITNEQDLDAAFEDSSREPVLVFKHSLVCPVSTAAFHEYLRFVKQHGEEVRCTLIEIQTNRPLSHQVAERTGVRHESPQALLLRDGEVAWHASHGAITESSLAEALQTS